MIWLGLGFRAEAPTKMNGFPDVDSYVRETPRGFIWDAVLGSCAVPSTGCSDCSLAVHPFVVAMPRVRSLRSQAISPKRDLSPRPPSPTYSETTNASVLNFGPDGPQKIITRAHLKMSLQSYEEVRITLRLFEGVNI